MTRTLIRLPILISTITAAAVLVGCTHDVYVVPQSGAPEVMPSKIRTGKAYAVFGDGLLDASVDVKPGAICRFHDYPMPIGHVLRTSLMQTLKAAYPKVIDSGRSVPNSADGLVFKFELSDFEPTIRFEQTWLVPTIDATVDLSLVAHVYNADGKELITTSFRGHGHAREDGDCFSGDTALSSAAKKAVAGVMENLVDKVINTDALK